RGERKRGEVRRAREQRVVGRLTLEEVRGLVEYSGFDVRRVISERFTLRFPSPRAFLTSPLIQTTYMVGWRSIIPDLTIRRLVFNEVERRLAARTQASGGALVMTVPMLCLYATRV